jgi:iron(III) transport system substrate-binding protein
MHFQISSLLCFLALLLAGCSFDSSDEVVVYTALDREFSQPILDRFSEESRIRTLPKYDVESTKTVGLTSAIMAEANRPRCDVFWNNEILNTLRLQEKGLLEAYHSPTAESYPEMYRDPKGHWHGFAARARILIVNRNEVPEDQRPKSIHDLLDPKWKGKIGIAKPLFGTTATHAACLFAAWGDEKAKDFFARLKANDVKIMSGNKQVAMAAGTGEIAFGLTDTDDALVEIDHASPVVIVYPDRGEDELGTLFIPNTLSIIKGCRHPESARKLVDFLLSPGVERELALSPSGQIPLNPEVDVKPRVETPRTVKAMPADLAKAAKKWDAVAKYLREEFMAPR